MAGIDDVDISKFSPRVACLVKLLQLARKIHQRRYYVRRGPINWSAFAFERYPFGIAILTPEFSLLGDEHGMDGATITLELVQRMPDETLDRDQQRDGLDDIGLESLVTDAHDLIGQLERSQYPNNDFVCTLLRPSAAEPQVSAQEMTSEDWGIQGIQATFSVRF